MRIAKGPFRARAFTLIELLVVTGVIAVLIAVLIPVLRLARQRSQGLACTGNLRQWGQAVLSYATDNNGYLPRRGQGKQVTSQITRQPDWFNALPPMLQMQPYMELAAAGRIPRPGGSSSVWVCPAAVDVASTNYFSYGMNMGLSVWDADENNGKPNNLAAVGNAATMVFLADGPGDRCSVFPSKAPGGYNPVARHNGRVNICFLDGHVAAMEGSYIGVGTGLIERSDLRWHPPNSGWNGAE